MSPTSNESSLLSEWECNQDGILLDQWTERNWCVSSPVCGLYYAYVVFILMHNVGSGISLHQIDNVHFEQNSPTSYSTASSSFCKARITYKSAKFLEIPLRNGSMIVTVLYLKTLKVGHGGSSAGLYLADPTSPIPSHCAVIIVFKSAPV